MSNLVKGSLVLPAVLAGSLLFSAASQAAVVWAVKSGDPMNSNSADTPLAVGPGAVSIDLYMNPESQTSYGWDIDLNVVGTGTISNVTGAHVTAADGGVLGNGGWQQIGGDPAGQAGEFVMMSFDFLGDAGAEVQLSGLFTNSSFLDEALPQSTVLQVVPLPAAAWFMGSALLGLIGLGRARKSIGA